MEVLGTHVTFNLCEMLFEQVNKYLALPKSKRLTATTVSASIQQTQRRGSTQQKCGYVRLSAKMIAMWRRSSMKAACGQYCTYTCTFPLRSPKTPGSATGAWGSAAACGSHLKYNSEAGGACAGEWLGPYYGFVSFFSLAMSWCLTFAGAR